jgi:hypothetical protein
MGANIKKLVQFGIEKKSKRDSSNASSILIEKTIRKNNGRVQLGLKFIARKQNIDF